MAFVAILRIKLIFDMNEFYFFSHNTMSIDENQDGMYPEYVEETYYR